MKLVQGGVDYGEEMVRKRRDKVNLRIRKDYDMTTERDERDIKVR